MVAFFHLDAGKIGVHPVHATGKAGGDEGNLPLVVVDLSHGAELLEQFAVCDPLRLDPRTLLEPGLLVADPAYRHEVHTADRTLSRAGPTDLRVHRAGPFAGGGRSQWCVT